MFPSTLGIPHRVMSDDVYRGMFIPKGSTIIANAAYVPTSTQTKRFHILMVIMSDVSLWTKRFITTQPPSSPSVSSPNPKDTENHTQNSHSVSVEGTPPFRFLFPSSFRYMSSHPFPLPIHLIKHQPETPPSRRNLERPRESIMIH